MEEEIQIQMGYIDRIDKVIACNNSLSCTRDEFIISAIEKKLSEIESTNR